MSLSKLLDFFFVRRGGLGSVSTSSGADEKSQSSPVKSIIRLSNASLIRRERRIGGRWVELEGAFVFLGTALPFRRFLFSSGFRIRKRFLRFVEVKSMSLVPPSGVAAKTFFPTSTKSGVSKLAISSWEFSDFSSSSESGSGGTGPGRPRLRNGARKTFFPTSTKS